MSSRNLKRLPLLEAFDAIMTRGSLVAAADAMNVTQSAVSKQLAQLREWLGDDLFVRTSDGMQPTPRALALRERIESLLEQAASLAREGSIQPADFTGEFVLSATDEVLDRLVPDLVGRLADEAPQLRLITIPIARDYSARQLEAGQVNLLVAVNWHAPDQLKQKRLGSDSFVCLMREDNPLADRNLTLKRYIDATHVLVAPLGYAEGVVDVELKQMGVERHVCASVPAFSMINESVLGGSRITTIPSRVAQRLADNGPFVVKRAPLKLPSTDYYALWHPRFTADPRLRWMLELVTASFGDS
ncbi:MAG: LysR family transcriptional regulator [Woeseiaceae bacterium]|nr:LysR family transcriptional regulator [Woeseiaceae bacterium]